MTNLNSVKYEERETGDVNIIWSEKQEIPSPKRSIRHKACLLWLSAILTVIYFCSEQGLRLISLVLGSNLSWEAGLTRKTFCYFPCLFQANAGILGRAHFFPSLSFTNNPVSDSALPVIKINYSKKSTLAAVCAHPDG